MVAAAHSVSVHRCATAGRAFTLRAVLATLGAAALAGLVPAAAPLHAADREIPRTASGRPDLSGVYDLTSLTPFERPEKYGERLTLSDDEAAAIESAQSATVTRRAQDSDPDREPPTKGGEVGAYNDFWFEWGSGHFAIDGKYRTSVLVDPPDGRMPELTPAGSERSARAPRFAWKNTGDAWWMETGDTPYDGPEDSVLGVRCIYQPPATVPMRPLPYNNMKTIVQTPDHVVILVEWMHWARVVRLDSEHLPSELRSLGGDSIGWWEGDTLVVETTNFLESPGVPKEGMRVLERFTPVDADSLVYRFTVEDPDYVAPYSGEVLWPRSAERSFEYACHEGNYAMGNTLRGARLLEAEWREHRARSESP